jgi:hypothetical protein
MMPMIWGDAKPRGRTAAPDQAHACGGRGDALSQGDPLAAAARQASHHSQTGQNAAAGRYSGLRLV